VSDFDHRWHISSHSGGDGCVQARHDGCTVRVRDSKDPLGPVLTFNEREWDAFVRGVRSGEFDLEENFQVRSA